MNIAVANTARNYGGQEAMALALANGLAERGHDVLFLCRPVYPALGRLTAAVRVEAVLGGTDWSPLSIARARAALRAHGSRVLLATTNKDMRSAAVAAWTAGVPVVIRRAMYRPLRDSVHYRLLYGKLAAHVVSNSRATLDLTLHNSPWLDAGRTSLILNGIDADRFANATPADLGLPAGAVAVGFVGRLVDWKGVLDLAAAWPEVAAAVPEAHLVIAGTGDLEPQMRAALTDAPRVHWLGFRRDVPEVMRALDVLAYPSWMEGFGLAAAEGMAAGIPVVGARAGSLPELIDDGAEGRLVPPHDAAALAEALIQLARDPSARARMGAAGRQRVARQFRTERMIDEFETLLTRVARQAAAQGGDARG